MIDENWKLPNTYQLTNSTHTQKKNLCSGIFMIKKNKFLICTITFSYLKCHVEETKQK